jgi:hypothetical protein
MKRSQCSLLIWALTLVPCLAHGYSINFDALPAYSPIIAVTAGGSPDISVSFSSSSVNALYLDNAQTTTSPANYLTTGVNDPSIGFYLSPFLPGDVVRLDFSAAIFSLSADFIITAGGPTVSPFAISDSATGGSSNSISSAPLDPSNGFDLWTVAFTSSTPFTTAYLISTPASFEFEGNSYPVPYSFNVDSIHFSAVPEPSSLLMLALGGLGLLRAGRRARPRRH